MIVTVLDFQKKGGLIRLIVNIDKENNIVKLKWIDMKHYQA